MFLASIHPGISLIEVRENSAWELGIAQNLEETPAPTEEELRLIRQELDREGAYTR
jgi:glutaconate CoA-transferase subunit B